MYSSELASTKSGVALPILAGALLLSNSLFRDNQNIKNPRFLHGFSAPAIESRLI
jgi:hypothetical protein